MTSYDVYLHRDLLDGATTRPHLIRLTTTPIEANDETDAITQTATIDSREGTYTAIPVDARTERTVTFSSLPVLTTPVKK